MKRSRTAPGGAVVRGRAFGPMVLFLALAGFGCDSSAAILALDGTPQSLIITLTPPAPGEVVATPLSLELEVGESVALSATALDAVGQPVGSPALEWTSSDEAVAIVGADGMVEAVAAGSADIMVTVDGVKAQLGVDVSAPS